MILLELEPAHPEPVEIEPVDLEPVDLELEPAHPEPVEIEPAELEPVDFEPAELEPVDFEPFYQEPGMLESTLRTPLVFDTVVDTVETELGEGDVLASAGPYRLHIADIADHNPEVFSPSPLQSADLLEPAELQLDVTADLL